MKISVSGKGGSGKSTITALLAREFARKNFSVLVIDSDESNTNLYLLLNLDSMPTPLMKMVGGKQSIQRKLRQAVGFQFLSKGLTMDEIPDEFIAKKDKINLVVVGKILQSNEGCACPMGSLTKEFLKKLNLRNNEIVVADMEAGIEHFGRGIEKYVDVLIVAIEPSYESIGLALRIKELAEQSNIKKIFAVINYNKQVSQNIKEKIEDIVREKFESVFSIPYSEEILNFGIISEKFSEGEDVRESVKCLAAQILREI
ncbi:MAG: ATP-binding protein [Candidatus Altiarchaeales archaeon HGW-Altiarchaeales-1]|nr:MAG: ATP-binding protein [Candidatus Altiarchaeales archaeon HGW-Altiarchaeales-1]